MKFSVCMEDIFVQQRHHDFNENKSKMNIPVSDWGGGWGEIDSPHGARAA